MLHYYDAAMTHHHDAVIVCQDTQHHYDGVIQAELMVPPRSISGAYFVVYDTKSLTDRCCAIVPRQSMSGAYQWPECSA